MRQTPFTIPKTLYKTCYLNTKLVELTKNLVQYSHDLFANTITIFALSMLISTRILMLVYCCLGRSVHHSPVLDEKEK